MEVDQVVAQREEEEKSIRALLNFTHTTSPEQPLSRQSITLETLSPGEW